MIHRKETKSLWWEPPLMFRFASQLVMSAMFIIGIVVLLSQNVINGHLKLIILL